MRRFDAHLEHGGRVPHRLAAVVPPSDDLVAMGEIAQLPRNYHPQKYWVTVLVDPPVRQRGIGRALYDRLEAEARRRDATTLWVTVGADEADSMNFARSRGFVEVRRQRQSRVRLAESRADLLADRSAELGAIGVEFTTLAAEGPEREEVRREYFRLHNVSSEGMPAVGTRTFPSYEEFVELDLSGPGFFPEGIFLALRGREYVGVTVLNRSGARSDLLRVGFTGTDPRFRGRGLATELKRRSIEFARSRGFSAVETWNDYENPRIWSINERVGFRTIHTVVTAERSLGPAA
jgi:mycothiol synthase